MPFVVFISPPSFERLKLNRRKMGEKDVKEDDLKSIIYEAKETEDKFGHMFDKVIVNYDLDRAYQELRTVIHRLETEPQWVPCHWLKDPNASLTRY
uniref:Guanylate kinase-like domain-containing protein n=1 Tax=Romanomermis culicivorax TaxID=13658 RepID=A0A915HT75_ROMCU